jgi:AcrR family transcriptional regulator
VDRKEAILDAAVLIADEGGLDAVSMRTVADRVGVTPMALYPHIGSKAALLDAMMGRLMGELLPATGAGASWQDQLDELAHAGRSLAKRHPWIGFLMFSRPSVAPDAVRVTDAIYEALLTAGIPAAEVPRLERMLSTFILGYGLSETGGRFGHGNDPRSTRGQLADGPLPGHSHLARWLDQVPDWDAEFDADLADLHQLIEAKARQGSGAADGG